MGGRAAGLPDGLKEGLVQVSEIVLERGGDGEPQGLRVRVRSDGLVEHTRSGLGRFRTEDETHTARLAAGEFQALVQLLRAQRFDTLAEIHDDPESADGAWGLLRVTHAGGQQQVWWRAERRPAAVQPIEDAVLALGRRASSGPR